MVTVPDMLSGPVNTSAVAPAPAADRQPSGRLTGSLGAAGSPTAAGVSWPPCAGVGLHRAALGGMCSRDVRSIPGTGSAGSAGRFGPEDIVVAGAGAPGRLVVLSHATNTDRQI